jgi:hypothetical protein
MLQHANDLDHPAGVTGIERVETAIAHQHRLAVAPFRRRPYDDERGFDQPGIELQRLRRRAGRAVDIVEVATGRRKRQEIERGGCRARRDYALR